MKMKTETVTYLRDGRKRRAHGTVVDEFRGFRKVRPDHYGWRHVWLAQAEIDAGEKKPKRPPP